MKLSSKLFLITRFGFTLLNLYLVGYLMINSGLIISLLATFSFVSILVKAAVMVVYIQWRSDNNWVEEWESEDEYN
jgi:poly(3-hydroxyalkanoate) synthetase